MLNTTKGYTRYGLYVLLGIILLPHTALLAIGFTITAVVTFLVALANQIRQLLGFSYPSIMIEYDIYLTRYPPLLFLIFSIVAGFLLILAARWLWQVTKRYWQFLMDERPGTMVSDSVQIEKEI